MRKLYFIIVLLTYQLSGQVLSDKGRFSVEFAAGCVPYTVNLTEVVNFDPDPVTYTYEPGALERSDTFYTYTVPGSYEIIQLTSVGSGNDKLDTLRIEVYDPVPPVFNYYYCSVTEVSIDVTDQLYDYFDLITPVDTTRILPGDPSLTLTGMSSSVLDVTLIGYHDNTFPNCGTATTAINLQSLNYDVSVTSSQFDYVCDDELELLLQYSANPNSYYEIDFRTDVSGFSNVYSGPLPDTSITIPGLFVDATLTEACFRVNVISRCGTERIDGTDVCQAIDTDLSAFSLAYATYTPEKTIQLIFSENNNGEFNALKYVDEEPFVTLSGLQSGYEDVSVYPLRKYAYDLLFTPGCEARNQEVRISTGYIRSKSVRPNSHDIYWEEPVYRIADEPTYQLVVSNEDESESRIIDTSANPIRINIDYTYGVHQKVWIEWLSPDEGLVIRSNVLDLYFQYVVYIPQAFTPNGDGHNDVLEIFGLPSDVFTLRVYNRWGESVFVSTEKENQWNGKSPNGKIVGGTYVYTIDFLSDQGKLITQQGSFVILK